MKNICFFSLMLVFTYLIAAAPVGAIQFQSSDIKINSGSTVASEDMALVNNGSGGVYAAWIDYRNPSDQVYFNYSADYGRTWNGTDVQFSTTTSSDIVLACAGNNVYAVWTEDFYPGTERKNVIFRRSTNNGQNWSIPFNIATDAENNQEKAQIATDGGNCVYVIWKDFNSYAINFRRSTDGGANWLPVTQLAADFKDYPILAADSSGNVYAGWQDSDYSDGNFIVRHSSNYGSSFASGVQVNKDYPDGPSSYASLGSCGNNVYGFWFSQTGNYDFRFNRSTDNGAIWGGTDTVLNTDTSGYTEGGSFQQANDQNGNVYAVWTQERFSGVKNIFLNSSSNSGQSWRANDVRFTTYTSDYPEIAANDNGSVIVVYEDTWRSDTDILYFRYSSDSGGSWDSEAKVSQASPNDGDQRKHVVSCDGSNVYVLWRERRGGSYDAYFNYAALPAGSVPPGDYDGDGTSDIGVFRSTSGVWAVKGITRVYFGSSADWPAPRDYNGDRAWDITNFKASSGLWAIRGITRAYFGTTGDVAAPGDYSGDGSADIGVFRDTPGLWAIRGITRAYFGTGGDEPVGGDYDGDGIQDIAVYRSSGLWAVKGITRAYFGGTGSTPASGDYDGDGTYDIGIFKESAGLWAVKDITRAYFGTTGDDPVRADYDGNGSWDIAVFRASGGTWAVRDITRVYFGTSGDIPVNSPINP